MKKEKKVDYLIRTGIISEEIDKIEINLRGELKIFLMNYYLKLLFDKYNRIYFFAAIPWIYPTWDYAKDLNNLNLRFDIFINRYKKKFRLFKSYREQKILCIEFSEINEIKYFFNEYIGYFQEAYLITGNNLDFIEFSKNIYKYAVFDDYIEESQPEFYEGILKNYDFLSYWSMDETYFEIASKNKKLLKDFANDLKNSIDNKLNDKN